MQLPPRRKVFVSYHHGADAEYYEVFVALFSGIYALVQDHSVERTIGSEDPDYVIRRIRENYLKGASVTVVLCGRNTFGRKYVDWEILASLNQGMGLVGLNLPTNPEEANGKYTVPARLHDNIESGYALFRSWDSLLVNPSSFSTDVEEALKRPKSLIDNSRPKRLRNEPLR